MWINPIKGTETSLEQQEQPPRRFVLLSYNVGDLNHRSCRDYTIEVLAQCWERLDDRRLGDRVEVLPLIEHELHMGESLQPPTESTLRLANTLRNRSQLPPIGADQDNNLVRLTERIRPEHNPRVVVERHEPQGTAALPSSWGATARRETLDTRLETVGPVSRLASPVWRPSQNPIRSRVDSLRCQSFSTLTRRSRNTGTPKRLSSSRRVSAPTVLISSPPFPMTMPFCDWRST